MPSSLLSSEWLQWGAVIGASLVAAVFDWRQRRIPNWLTGLTLLAGLVYATGTSGFGGLGYSLLAAVLVSSPFVLLFVFAGGGAGDAKMMAAIGAWLGVVDGGIALAGVCFSGVALAFTWAALRGGLRRVVETMVVLTCGVLSPILGGRSPRDVASLLPPVHDDDQKMPYGLAIFVGVSVSAGVVLL